MSVRAWWAGLSAVAAINIAIWACAAASLDTAGVQVALSAIYVFGCAYRSFLPVYDIPRICIVDSWASSVLVGRTIATLAELAFAAQWAVYLHASDLEAVRLVSLAIVPLIAIAQLCCWHAVLTTSNRGHVIENSLWGIAAVLIVGSLVATAAQGAAHRGLALAVWTVGGALFVAYIFIVDVPMYWQRWKAEEALGRRILSYAQGFADLSRRRVVSLRWEDWRSEVTWMTLYFTIGVWVSLSLVFASEYQRRVTTAAHRGTESRITGITQNALVSPTCWARKPIAAGPDRMPA